MISFLDNQIGRVLGALEESGQTDNTRIIYTSDHGEMAGSYGLWGKSCMYEDSAGVPFIVAGPDLPTGQVSDQNVSLIDCFPSILDCVGVPLGEEDADLPGTSLWPIARGEESPDRIAFAEYHALFSTVGNYMVKDDRYKLVYYAGNKYPPNLFDLQKDPSELVDLGQDPAYADTITRLETELRKVCNPEAVNEQAFADQRAMVDRHGGEATLLAQGLEINFSPAPGFM